MFILGIENPVMRRMRDRTGKNVKSMGTPHGSVSVNSSHIGKKDRIGAKRFGAEVHPKN
jgi:hypothetical protein